MSVGLVLQGGGHRGAYTAGILQGLYSEGIRLNYVAGVSAGALTGINYVSGQPRRNYETFVKYASDPRYMGFGHLKSGGSYFNFDFLLGTLAYDLMPFDFDAFYSSPCRMRIGTIDCNTGEAVYFDKKALRGDRRLTVLRASASLPLFANVEYFDGRELMDGGLADPIPIERSIADGNEFNIIVLTRNSYYINKKDELMRLYRRDYGHYPRLLEALEYNHELCLSQRKLCHELEREGKAVVLQPIAPLKVNLREYRWKPLAALHDTAMTELAGRMGDIRALIARDNAVNQSK